MTPEIPPAIVRAFGEGDSNAHVARIVHDSVSFTPGFGDSGYRVEIVEHDCPACGFDRMTRRHDVRPESPDEVRYWCLNPNCAHYLRDELSHACKGSYPHREVSTPKVSE